MTAKQIKALNEAIDSRLYELANKELTSACENHPEQARRIEYLYEIIRHNSKDVLSIEDKIKEYFSYTSVDPTDLLDLLYPVAWK